VEYWEQDPCAPDVYDDDMIQLSGGVRIRSIKREEKGGGYGVTVEARFEVGEYQVVILSAKDSGGLDRWLRDERYHIPEGAEEVLRPYVQAGTKFFVAKVNPDKVRFVDGRAVLSPLRMHYDTDTFQLPVRLGLLNSHGQQDLIVHLLARNQRYEVANYDNAFIPTNLRVRDEVRESFASFYDSVFREVARPGTVVTEYSWDASSCDPCPLPPLDGSDLATLGGDVMRGGVENAYGWTLTRLHYRYGPEGLKEDLVFRAAPPVIGGRGMPDVSGELSERSAQPSGSNQFQGRYVILHPWDGALACEHPTRGRWGGPGGDKALTAGSSLGGGVARASRPLPELLLDGFGDVRPRDPAKKPPPAGGIPELEE
ncbi:MAG: DUF2330 domain-containing protein, partial [Myxococcales bacterium]|nr:DUF2330 domain-containing protein [Myxococcales bacterium]